MKLLEKIWLSVFVWGSPLQFLFATGSKVVTPPCAAGKLCNPIKYNNLQDFLLGILDIVIQYGALLIVFFIVFAGFKFVTAQGNTEKIADARKMLVWIIVGAFVLLGVYVIKAAICGTLVNLGVTGACGA